MERGDGQSPEGLEPVRPARGRFGAALKRLDQHPRLIATARAARKLLPGDPRYGDPLSVAGREPSQLIGQRLAATTSTRPSALREAGFSALQVWQSLSEAQGRGYGDREVAIVFTDLVGFSDWVLEAGDTLALELLRHVGQVVEPIIDARGGEVVKRLGDGLMAVFQDAGQAVEAALEASRGVGELEVGNHRPQLRVGVHVGRPRRLGGDFFGVDVNIAARVAAAAGAGEVLVSEHACQRIEADKLTLRRRWRFSAKGAPKDLKVYAAEPRG